MTEDVPFHYRTGPTPKPPQMIGLEKAQEWLKEIIKPVIADPTTEHSIEFVDLAPSHDQHGYADGQDLSRVTNAVKAMGLSAKQIVVESDTIDFNIHYSAASRLVLEQDQFLPLYSIADNEFGICWTWDSHTCSLRGMVWHFNRDGKNGAMLILNSLARFGPTYNHVVLPALMVLQMEVNAMHKWVDRQGEKIMECQFRTGYHHYSDADLYVEQGNTQQLMKLNLEQMSKDICGYAVNITTSVLCLERLVQLADFVLLEATESIRPEATSTPKSDDGQRFGSSTSSIVRQARSARRHAEGLLAEAQAWKHKSTIVVQTLLSLTSQRDQNISISIARQATRDSTSMKAIAAVTMCFLPGTFVSTLFAAPFFNWQTDTSKSISPKFWIYWAVTLPLTFLVIVVWLFWTHRSLEKVRINKEEGS